MQERGCRSLGGNSSRTGLLFQGLSTSTSSSFSSPAMRGPTRIPRRSVQSASSGRTANASGNGGRSGWRRLRAARGQDSHHRLQQLPPSFSTAAGAAAPGSRTSRRRTCSQRPLTMMMMASSSPVTDKDIMREFVTVAASEAASSVKNKPPSAVLNGDSKHNGAAGANATPGAAGKEVGDGTVDEARPTGYRYSAVDLGLLEVLRCCDLECVSSADFGHVIYMSLSVVSPEMAEPTDPVLSETWSKTADHAAIVSNFALTGDCLHLSSGRSNPPSSRDRCATAVADVF